MGEPKMWWSTLVGGLIGVGLPTVAAYLVWHRR
jgi:hypothetical protein